MNAVPNDTFERTEQFRAVATSVNDPVVGLSANVLDPRLTKGRIDGIGVYTQSMEEALAAIGLKTRRIHSPALAGGRYVGPPEGALGFAMPVAASVAAATLLDLPIAGASKVEGAIDLYHATDYLVPPLRRTPVVATIHDAIPLMRPDWASARLRGLKNWILRSAIPRADLVIAISNAVVPDIIEHYRVPPTRIRVVAVGVDAQWFVARPPDSVRATLDRLGLRAGFLLFVGTLQPRKNVGALLAAYDRLPRAFRAERQLVIVGRAGWGVDELTKQLVRRRVDGECMWLDYVDNDSLRDLYAAACAFVMPSLAEGFCLPLLEAMAAGLPLVASNLPVFREVAGEFATYVEPEDADALAAAIVDAAQPLAAAQMARRRTYAKSFEWREVARRTLDVYREVL